MNQGFSGALIEEMVVVRKTAPDAYEQHRRCIELGSSVCPEVYAVDSYSYMMEKLYPAGQRNMREVKNLLRDKVWHRTAYVDPWKKVFLTWVDVNVTWDIIRDFEHLYSEDAGTLMIGCETHGDPTWANAMRNSSGELRLIDPLPARPEKPKLREVDLGKMLQSEIGWEEVLVDGAEFRPERIAASESVIADEPDIVAAKARFWLRVHLWRLLPFAAKNNRPDIAKKAEDAFHAVRI